MFDEIEAWNVTLPSPSLPCHRFPLMFYEYVNLNLRSVVDWACDMSNSRQFNPRCRSFALLARAMQTCRHIAGWTSRILLMRPFRMVHFQAILTLLLLFLQQIDSKISKSDRGYILRLVQGDMATQFDSGCCFSFAGWTSGVVVMCLFLTGALSS